MATEYKTIPVRLTPDQHRWLEDRALEIKRSGDAGRGSINALIREAIDEYRDKRPGK
jgi:hypothetical protein